MNTPTITRRRREPLLRYAAIALATWIGGMAALALVIDPPAVAVFGRPADMIAAVVESDGALLTANAFVVTARLPLTGGVRRLYASGAWLVWPMLRAGCGASIR